MKNKLIDALLPLFSLLIFVSLLVGVGYFITGTTIHQMILAAGSKFEGHPYVIVFTATMALFGASLQLIRMVEATNPGSGEKE